MQTVVALFLAVVVGVAKAVPTPVAETLAASHLVRRNYTTDTSNQLVDGTACRAVTVIYARGTWEDGNVGSADEVGLETFNNLAALVGEDNLALQGVDYPADVAGFEQGGDPDGSLLMAKLTTQVSTCVITSNASQGLCESVTRVATLTEGTNYDVGIDTVS